MRSTLHASVRRPVKQDAGPLVHGCNTDKPSAYIHRSPKDCGTVTCPPIRERAEATLTDLMAVWGCFAEFLIGHEPGGMSCISQISVTRTVFVAAGLAMSYPTPRDDFAGTRVIDCSGEHRFMIGFFWPCTGSIVQGGIHDRLEPWRLHSMGQTRL